MRDLKEHLISSDDYGRRYRRLPSIRFGLYPGRGATIGSPCGGATIRTVYYGKRCALQSTAILHECMRSLGPSATLVRGGRARPAVGPAAVGGAVGCHGAPRSVAARALIMSDCQAVGRMPGRRAHTWSARRPCHGEATRRGTRSGTGGPSGGGTARRRKSCRSRPARARRARSSSRRRAGLHGGSTP